MPFSIIIIVSNEIFKKLMSKQRNPLNAFPLENIIFKVSVVI